MAAVPKEYPDGSIHRSPGWQGQLARVSRWLDRLMRAASPEDAEDFLYAYFQNCYHLRDWLPETSQVQGDALFKNSMPMRICRDIANVTKHFVLNRPPAQGHELSILREYAGPGNGWYEDDSRLVVVTNEEDDGIVLDAREVAKECLRLWCETLPDCDIVREIQRHFMFSAQEFQGVVSKAHTLTQWAKGIVDGT